MKLDPRSMAMLMSSIVSVVLVSLVSMVPVPYALMRPGPVKDVLSSAGDTPLISISGHETYPTSGSLDLVTIRVSGGPGSATTAWELMSSWFDPTSDARPIAEVYPPDRTQQQIDEVNAAEMVSSQEAATAAALSELGIPFSSHVTAARVPADSGAHGHLRDGDVIASLDGRPVTSLDDLRTQLTGIPAGQDVTVGVLRDGEPADIRFATTATTDPDGTHRTVLGVLPGASYEFPFEVKISIDNIGGPSAGMMFSLGIIDKLTPGGLAGDQRVAGTGTISADGRVGAIGGVRQKVFAARDAGASWFLVPADNCAEIHQVPDGLRVVRVATLEEAYTAVQGIGAGDQAAIEGLPSCTR